MFEALEHALGVIGKVVGRTPTASAIALEIVARHPTVRSCQASSSTEATLATFSR
jgi:hypothetical protein